MDNMLQTPIISDETLDHIRYWCNIEFGDELWSWDLCGSYIDGYDTFYFDNEEDKVKFILKWL